MQSKSAVTYLSEESSRVIVVANPKAGARSGRPIVTSLVELLGERGFSVELTTDIDHAEREVQAALARGELRTVVAAGGDGTAALLVNRTPDGVPIMTLPLGTENLLARHFGVRADPKLICETICHGATTRIDAGRANGQIFFMVVSCGFDAEVVRRLHARRSGHIQRLSYVKPILDTIRSYQYPELRVYCGESEEAVSARWVFVNNIPKYAMGLPIVPDAIETDGLLDVCTFKKGSFWTGLFYLTGVLLGLHKSWKDCVNQRARRIRIQADEEVPYELDGDPGGVLPLEIEVLPHRLRLLVPEKWVAAHGAPVAEETN